jgi:hypothetical protein
VRGEQHLYKLLNQISHQVYFRMGLAKHEHGLSLFSPQFFRPTRGARKVACRASSRAGESASAPGACLRPEGRVANKIAIHRGIRPDVSAYEEFLIDLGYVLAPLRPTLDNVWERAIEEIALFSWLAGRQRPQPPTSFAPC